jgi:hypothetical protein
MFCCCKNNKRHHHQGIPAPIIILTGSANHLMELEEWVGPGKYPTLHTSKDGDIMRGVLELLHHRVSMGFPTFFVKVRAHRGEPFNEAADRIASMASEVDGAPLLWNAKSGRIIYQFAMDPSDLEAVPYSASMNDTVKKFIKSQAAVSDFYSSNSERVLWNPLCDGLTVAEISWAHVWLTRRSRMELRSDSCNG